jgi:hypothetical protein
MAGRSGAFWDAMQGRAPQSTLELKASFLRPARPGLQPGTGRSPRE